MIEAQTSIGKILNEPARRDAIHFAVAPVVAADDIRAGAHVGLLPDGRASCDAMIQIGIADPFLLRDIKAGERFWLFLYPNTITTLRHEWEHPAFSSAEISRDDHVAKSQAWIDAHAELLGLTADVMLSNAERWLRTENYTVQHDSERWRDNFNPAEFWHHYEVVTGTAVDPEKKQSFYCCTC